MKGNKVMAMNFLGGNRRVCSIIGSILFVDGICQNSVAYGEF